MNFEWHERKAAANLKKHKVSFEEAQAAFEDSLFVAFEDPDHSAEENRFVLIGESNE